MDGSGLHKSDYTYYLPEELIAQDPLPDRASSRLLVLNKETGEISHRHFKDVLDYLNPGDCLVLNDTKVIPARLIGEREGGTAPIEVLLLKRLPDKDLWEALVRPGKKLKAGSRVSFGKGLLKGEIVDIIEGGNRIIKFSYEGIFEELLQELGEMPLPPYIHKKLEDGTRYNTVYARAEGSAAAPTAGLHFTEELLSEIREKGIRVVSVTLHVGLGTFRPVKTENILDHEMHSESYSISKEAADIINEVKESGEGRIIAVGTTSTRTLESAASENGLISPVGHGETSLFIYPGYRFKVIDGLITNFHLPESTLLMLVSAFAGRERVLNAYKEAVREKYRVFSFGDAMMLI
ncbi:MAG: tRNA preQ1(34) S-adenosylmethionine ribosyltransferase-isomerase QueA [Lachnospiraceae bacterium]|nr:tRNA preQ1(34) S-adenosylmethionine ribosyltransferase-isomerase QueA [Lachnospiraceae bacterium]